MEWINWRNEELHTGSSPFDELPTSEWLPNFYRISTILLHGSEKALKDFVGEENSETATEMINALSAQVKQQAYSMVRNQKEQFERLSIEDRLNRITDGGKRVKNVASARSSYRKVQCPACEGDALLAGTLIRSTVPRDREGSLVQEDVWLPSALACPCCELKIQGHAQVAALGLGNKFTTTDVLDPQEYYEIEFDPSEYYREDGYWY